MELLDLPVASIRPDPEQPRKTFRKDTLEELADQIAEVGVLQPIRVRQVAAGDYVIVMGERRWRACTLLVDARRRIPGTRAGCMPCLVTTDEENLRVKQLLENLGREDMPALETAQGLQDLLDAGWTAEAVGRTLGRKGANSERYVMDRVAMLRMISMVKEALRVGAIDEAQAVQIARLCPEDQHRAFLAVRDGKLASQVELRKFVDDINARRNQGVLFEPKTLTPLERQAQNRFDESIDRVIRFLREHFDDENAVLTHVIEGQVDGRLAKVDVVMRYMRRLRKALKRAKARQVVIAETTPRRKAG